MKYKPAIEIAQEEAIDTLCLKIIIMILEVELIMI